MSDAYTTYCEARAVSYAWDAARDLAKYTPAYEAISARQEEAFAAFMTASNGLIGLSLPSGDASDLAQFEARLSPQP